MGNMQQVVIAGVTCVGVPYKKKTTPELKQVPIQIPAYTKNKEFRAVQDLPNFSIVISFKLTSH
jgi:hypothetical protein